MNNRTDLNPTLLVKVLRRVYPLSTEVYEALVDHFNDSSVRAEAELITMVMFFAAANGLAYDDRWGSIRQIPKDLLDNFLATAFCRLIETGKLK